MTKTRLDKLQDLICMFPSDRLNELPSWLQQDYHDLDRLIEDVLQRPGQKITTKEARWVNGVYKSVKKIPKKYYEELPKEKDPFEDFAKHMTPARRPIMNSPMKKMTPIPVYKIEPKLSKKRNKLCPCGSGMKRKRCCWKFRRKL